MRERDKEKEKERDRETDRDVGHTQRMFCPHDFAQRMITICL